MMTNKDMDDDSTSIICTNNISDESASPEDIVQTATTVAEESDKLEKAHHCFPAEISSANVGSIIPESKSTNGMVISPVLQSSFELQGIRVKNPSDTIIEVQPLLTDLSTPESPSASNDETREITTLLVGKQRPRHIKPNLKCFYKLYDSIRKFWSEYRPICVVVSLIILIICACVIAKYVKITLIAITNTSESASTPQYGGILNNLSEVVSETIRTTIPLFTEEIQLDFNTTALSSAKDETNSEEIHDYTLKPATINAVDIAADAFKN